MKIAFAALVLLGSSMAFADTVTCTFGEKYLALEVTNGQVVSADWSNPDWGTYGAQSLDLSQVRYMGDVAVVTGNALPDVNGTYVCN